MKFDLRLRRQLVAELEKTGKVKSVPVRRAFLAVPREVFVEDHARRGGLEAVYRDVPLVTKTDAKGGAISSSSQPAIMAIMLEAMRLRGGHHVLEIGTGTGYNAALLARIVGPRGSVTTVDIDPELVARARRALRRTGTRASVIVADGRAGHEQRSPYDRIIVTASTDYIPRAWWSQLDADGLLQVPFRLLDDGSGFMQSVVVFERTDAGFRSIDQNPGGFMGLRGAASEQAPLIQAARSLGLYEARGDKNHVFGYLSGKPLAKARREDRKRLARLLLEEPRTRKVASRSQSDALQVFLTLRLPNRSLVQYSADRYFGAGVVNQTFDGIAAAVRRSNGATEVRYFGRRDAERTLDEALSEWESLGSPGDRHLQLSVSFDGKPTAWRVLRRNDSYVGIGWARKRTP